MLDIKNTIFVCVDIQEKLIGAMFNKELILKNASIAMEGIDILGAQILVSEQYVKGLGKTIINIPQNAKVMEKSAFSIFNDEAIKTYIKSNLPKYIVLFGIESHVCMYQSALDAINLGIQPIILGDACGSREMLNHKLALQDLRSNGARILNVETLLFMLLKDSTNPHFKAISKLIK